MTDTAFHAGCARGVKIAAETRGAAARGAAARELLGLGLIAAPSAHGLWTRARGRKLTNGQEQVHAVSDLAGLGLLAAPYAKKLLTKSAGGGAAISDTTGSGAVTSGELERDVSAPGVTGQSREQPETRDRAAPGPRRGRGVPEWVRYLQRQAPAGDEVR